LLNDRLGHAQLVDAVVQGGDVLFQRLFLHLAGRFGLDGQQQLGVDAIGPLVVTSRSGKLVLQQVLEAAFQGVAASRISAVSTPGTGRCG
jgi:hypothetical protein